MKVSYIPEELLDIILAYDGRIKNKMGKYVDIIHKNDERYKIIVPILSKKMEILKNIDLRGKYFYFEFGFEECKSVGLCYDYGFNSKEIFEICYYDMRNNRWDQKRTYI